MRGVDIGVVGVDPVSYRANTSAPHRLVEPGVSFALLLCHFPGVALRMPPGSFDLVLAGHLHAGQISVPLGRRRVTLAHPRARFVAGLYETPAGAMHVSSGTGTTFVPFRFFARPEVTELILRREAKPGCAAPGPCDSGLSTQASREEVVMTRKADPVDDR